jgi:putative nucleotidyltransferase with HDIG domain
MNSMDLSSLRARVENVSTLPTIPKTLKRLIGVMENPRVSLNDISTFISNDPALTTKVLKMVNSPVYGFPGRISSVSQAVILLGLNVVKGLLLGVSVFELMQKSMIGLWEHSMGCAVIARLIAKRKGLKEPEELSVGGLLHDIGKVILILQYPAEYQQAMSVAQHQGITVFEAERDYFAAGHASVGAWVAQKWSFPRGLTDVIDCHHKPHLAKNAPLESAIVHLSDIMLRGRGFGFAGDDKVPLINTKAWESLELSREDLKEILREAEDSLSEAEELAL